MSKFGPGNRRWPGKGSLQLLEKGFLLGKVGIYLADDLPGEEPEFKQSLVALPGADAYENGDEQRKKQKHRQRHRLGSAAPEASRFAGDDEHQGRHDENAKGISDPPR